MSVRFVVGRAGAGKTHRCVEAVRAALRENPTEGPPLILLVPEQASFQMERAIIETPDLPGFTRCQVLSFQRLAYRIFAEIGGDPRTADQTIGKLGRLMALRYLIRRERTALRVLDRVADRAGLVREVAAAIEELMREGIEPLVLAELAEQADADDPLTAAKLADLTRLYQAYLDYLIDDRLDPAQYLELAAQGLEACDWVKDARVWVDGFAGFTHQEIELLVQLARHAAEVEIALLMDPRASAVDHDELPEISFSLFARTERTLVRLRKALKAAGLTLEPPVRLQPARPPRFSHAALATLERDLFAEHRSRTVQTPPPEVVCVRSLPDRRAEVEAAVAEIQRLVREASPPMRYRHIAVIVRDLAAYHDLLTAAMRSAGIPFFIDRREPTVHHPLIEMVRALLAVACDDCRLESVRLTLKTGLLSLAPHDADLLENYLLAHGLAGKARFEQPWSYTRIFARKPESGELASWQRQTLERVNAARRAWLAAVGPWLDGASAEAAMTGRRWATLLYECLEHNGVPRTLHAWADQAEQDGRVDRAQVHRQVWSDFVELLDEFVHALGGEPMTIDEFRDTIESGLAEFDLGLAPPTLDQVMVGAIERSRHPPVRAALVLGFDHVHFPLRRSEDPLLGDQEREALEKMGRPIAPSRHRQILDERLLAYIALTRASERLWISYPRSEADGQPIEPSPFLEEVRAMLPGLHVEHLEDPRAEDTPRGLVGVGTLGARLAGEFRSRPVEPDQDKISRRAIWNGLYERARQCTEWHHSLRRALRGLAYTNRAELEADLVERAFPEPFIASVSRLEQFAQCPFAHYARDVLRLEPRVESELGPVDVGTLCHGILEKFIGRLVCEGVNLAELEDDQIAEGIDAAAREILPELADDLLLTEARNDYLADRSRRYMARVMRWQRDAARVGRFRPRAVEYPFGYSGVSAAPLTLRTPKGRKVLLRGRIDRVDIAELAGELAGVVIDYKATNDRRLDWAKVYHGLSLQLVAYLLALEQAGKSLTGRPIRPVAALYLPLWERFEKVPHPDHEKKHTYRWRGIMDLSCAAALDRNIETDGKSEYLSARMTKDGRPYQNSDLTDRDTWKALLAHVGRRMGELADRLLDGDIEVKPYRLNRRMPCSYCPYRAVCRYEVETQWPRHLESRGDKAKTLECIKQEAGDE